MDINSPNDFHSQSKESNSIPFNFENQLQIESRDSIVKGKNMFNLFENKLPEKNLLFQREGVDLKEEHKKLEKEKEKEKEKRSNEKIINVKENKKSKVEVYDENIKVKNVLLCDKGQNLYNTDEKIRGDNKDMNNITNEQNKSCNNFMINNNIFSKNENIDDNISIFTSSIKENIPNTKEVIEKKRNLYLEIFSWIIRNQI